MRLTMRTNLALRTLMYCSVNEGLLVRKADIATACNVSLNHLGLVVNQLGNGGYLRTHRGRRGGITLARPATEITVGEVTRNLEGDTPLTECFETETSDCPLVEVCRLRGALREALESFFSHLDGVTIEDLTRKNTGLEGLLTLKTA